MTDRADTTGQDGAVACPACRKLTLRAEGAEEVCAYCGWQDDPAGRTDPAATTPHNGISLAQARWNVEQFGLAFPPSEAGV
jgi:hypothetical protein